MGQKEIVKVLDWQSAVNAINDLGEDDLKMLNRLIVERLHRLAHEKRNRLLGEFYVGDKVRFYDQDGDLKIGRVLRVNQKTISVEVEGSSGWWKVPPGMLDRIDSKDD